MQVRHRARAALTHLALSATVALLVFLTVYFFWFPDVLFEGAGGRDLFLVIVAVDVTLGPLLTFIIFVPGKKGLVFDLVVIATLQLAALAYGVWVLFEARPVYIVFVRDRFELTRANDISPEELEKAKPKGLDRLPMDGPRVYGSRLPDDPDESFRIMMSGLGGIDLNGYPRFYLPYEEVRDEVLRHGKTIERLRHYNRAQPEVVDRLMARIGRPEAQLRYLPMRAGKRDLTVVVDAKTAEVVRIDNVRPWEY